MDVCGLCAGPTRGLARETPMLGAGSKRQRLPGRTAARGASVYMSRLPEWRLCHAHSAPGGPPGAGARELVVGEARGWRRCAHLALGLLLVLAHWRTSTALPVANFDQGNTFGCIWRSSISPTMPREQVFWPRRECQVGELWWYDAQPAYILRVYFQYKTNGDFLLCLVNQRKGHVSSIHMRNGTVETPIDPPDKETDTCVKSQNGIVELAFRAPSFTVHVTVIEYFIRESEPP